MRSRQPAALVASSRMSDEGLPTTSDGARACVFAVTVPAESGYLRLIRGFFQSVLEDRFGEQSGLIVLALDESCSNIVKYRGATLVRQLIHVRAEIAVDSVRFRIGDFCATEDVPKIKPRELDDVRPGGLGTHFITQIMDRVLFVPDPSAPGRMALLLEKSMRREEVDDGTPG